MDEGAGDNVMDGMDGDEGGGDGGSGSDGGGGMRMGVEGDSDGEDRSPRLSRKVSAVDRLGWAVGGVWRRG